MVLGAAALAAGLLLAGGAISPKDNDTRDRVIVQARDLETAAGLVRAVGGEITHELGVIGAVGARLDAGQQRAIRARGGIRRIFSGDVTRVRSK